MQFGTVPVPHLSIAHNGPGHPIEQHILDSVSAIEHWFRDQWAATPAPITSSVDLRHAGFKLAPVDTNLFPAGFNNLNPDVYPLCVQAVQVALSEYMPSCERILLLPESHTRNTFYNQSLAVMKNIFEMAGFTVRIGNIDAQEKEALELSLPDGKALLVEPVARQGDRIGLKDFDPCFVLLNNDLSSGVPEVLKNLHQRIKPTEKLGWASRLKSSHFTYYDAVAREFSELLDIDHWLINPMFSSVEGVDFMAKEGVDALAESVDHLLVGIREKYQRLGIKEDPFVVVKADSGTYGMGVMMVQDSDALYQLNRKQRTKMAATKGSQKVQRVIIQEGVHSFETMEDGSVAEPVVYMIGAYVVGGFYRVHQGRGHRDNLNAPGMHFLPLAFDDACNMPDKQLYCGESLNRFYIYGVIARLAALAAAREIAAIGG